MIDIVAIGELLIDFTPSGENAEGMKLFSQNPGGAPANVLVTNAKLGNSGAFLGKVGADDFGNFLISYLDKLGIITKGIVQSENVNTTLAFVHLNEVGDRSFSFYRDPGADMMYSVADVDKSIIEQCNIFHFGSVSFTHEPARSTTIFAAELAKKLNKIISYDPNYRPLLWNDIEHAKEQMKRGLVYADIIKVSEDELELLTGTLDFEQGAEILSKYGATLILVTLGEKGAYFYKNGECGFVQAYKVDSIDTNGAGDAFLGAIHYMISLKTLDDIKKLSKLEIEEIVGFACAVGSLTTTKHGGITAVPCLDEVIKFKKNYKKN